MFEEAKKYISIHGSREGPDLLQTVSFIMIVFQSTGPVRDPTKATMSSMIEISFQSTGPVRDPTRQKSAVMPNREISIHGSREGPDLRRDGYSRETKNFNPRVP